MIMEEQRALYIIAESKTDAAILHSLLDCSMYQKVYNIPAGGYGNLSSVARTIRLMKSPAESSDKILIVFDSDDADPAERIATMRYLTNADYDRRIGVFCFVPDIENDLLKCDVKKKGVTKELIQYLKENLTNLKDNEVIKAMQEFINH